MLHTDPIQGEPATVTTTVTAQRCITSLRFDLAFRSDRDADARGILRVYVDGNLVFQADQSLIGEESVTSGEVLFNRAYEPGNHTIMFALESTSGGSAGILLENLELGLEARPSFLAPVRLSNGDILLTLTCLTPGRSYAVESSTDFVNWTRFASFQPVNATHQLTIPANALAGRKFFRAVAP